MIYFSFIIFHLAFIYHFPFLKLLIDNSLKIENCELIIATPRGVAHG